jgi:iron complex outermembrane recepter protein
MKKQNKTKQSKKKFQSSFLLRSSWTLLLLFIMSRGFCQEITEDSTQHIMLNCVGISWTLPDGEDGFSASSITRSNICDKAGNGSVNNMFDLVPSMITTSDAGTGIGYSYMRIRGIDQTRINVTINGIALNDAESQGSWFTNLPDFGANVQHLEVQRGVGTSNNGSAAFGATMNFSTLTPSLKPYLSVSSSAGSFYSFRNTVSASTGLMKERLSAAVSYSNILSNGYIDRASALLHSLFFTTEYRFLGSAINKNYGKIKFNLIYGNEKTGLAWNGVPSDSLANNRTYNSCGEYFENGQKRYYENETDNYQQTHFQLIYDYRKSINGSQYRHILNFDMAAHLTRGIGYYEEYQDDKDFYDYGLSPFILSADTILLSDLITRKYLDNYFYGGTFHFSHTLFFHNPENKITWSLGGAANRYDGKHYGTIIWMQYADHTGINAHWYDGIGDKRQYNLFGTLAFTMSDKIYTYVDLQYRCIDYRISGIDDNLTDISQNHLWHFFNPKIGLNYSWESLLKNQKKIEQSAYFSFAVANREPTRSDLTNADLAKRPQAETLYDLEVGYKIHGKKFSVAATGYYMYYKDQLILTGEINSVGAAVMTNAEKSYRTGIELIATYQPVRYFEWKINGTWSANKIINFTEYVDDWDTGIQRVKELGTTDISFSPNIVLGNELIVEPVRDFNISFVTKFVGKQYLDNSSNENYILKPYCINNLQLSYTIHTQPVSEINLFFQINNLFNAKYESNAWLYKYYYNNEECRLDGYYPQAGINFMGGIRLTFD